MERDPRRHWFHQWADFGVLGRWTADLQTVTILALALPWAVFSSAMEWFVWGLSFWQPLFTLQQPYWIGLLVHRLVCHHVPAVCTATVERRPCAGARHALHQQLDRRRGNRDRRARDGRVVRRYWL